MQHVYYGYEKYKCFVTILHGLNISIPFKCRVIWSHPMNFYKFIMNILHDLSNIA